MEIGEFSDLFEQVKNYPKRNMVVANGVDLHTLEAVSEAVEKGIVNALITGKETAIRPQCRKVGLNDDQYSVFECSTDVVAVETAVSLVRSGKADLIMKGFVNTDTFMHAILNKQEGLLPKGGLLTHIAMLKNKAYHKPVFVSDVAIIPAPDFEQKKQITNHLIAVAHRFGIAQPKVAFIAATEKVIEKMQACTDAYELKKAWEGGAFPEAICDGPMALDLAIDSEAAIIKNYKSLVAGDADCLLFPNIESGNVFYKMNTRWCSAEIAAIVIGTMVPTVLSSRGDTMQTKLNSIALAALMG